MNSMMNKEEVAGFYDAFVSHQLKVAFNPRQSLLFNELKNLGLSSGSSILELGCGIGVMTSLIAMKVRKGYIEAIDISSESIAEAQKRIKHQEMINFIVADLKFFESKRQNFDFITLMDVLEHFPQEDHDDLFRKISQLMHDSSALFISIPSPHSIAFDRTHFPENLQVVDQELLSDQLINCAYQAGLELDYFRTLSIWSSNDYQVMVFRKEIAYQNESIYEKRNYFCKMIRLIRLRFERYLLSKNYRLE
jgi:trans-aconitate 2-methyltransferase